MIKKLVQTNFNFIKNYTDINDIYELDRIRYGLEAFYNETTKLIILICFSLLLKKLSAFLIITFLLLTIRSFIGGSHRKTTLGCLFQSLFIYVSTYYIAYIFPNSVYIRLLVLLLACILILKYNPINRKRKKNSEFIKKRNQKYFALLTICLWCLVSSLLFSKYIVNCGTFIIIYILFDFYMDVKRDEKNEQN